VVGHEDVLLVFGDLLETFRADLHQSCLEQQPAPERSDVDDAQLRAVKPARDEALRPEARETKRRQGR
jgi:hypothetical protein